MLGFQELKLKFFPAFTLRDARKKKILGWNGTDWYELCQRGQASSNEPEQHLLQGMSALRLKGGICPIHGTWRSTETTTCPGWSPSS
ncbi:hypothetical protein KUCAC02_009605 [Chaenocephalus aceratus]|nr:hypothetical protein KUCAC02_009605 [Chaenocephalus aceratus]